MRRAINAVFALALLLVGLSTTAAAQSHVQIGPDQSVGVLSEDPEYGERWSTTVFPFGNYVGPDTSRDVFCRTYLRFPLSSVPGGATVESATLRVYVDDYWPQPGGAAMAAYPVTAAWTAASVDWLDMSAWPPLGAAAAWTDVSSTPGWYSWDVTALVQGWLAGTANHGLALAAAELTSTGADWAAARRVTAGDPATAPYLEVAYRTPQPTAEPETPLLPVTGESAPVRPTEWFFLIAAFATLAAGLVTAVELRRIRLRRERD